MLIARTASPAAVLANGNIPFAVVVAKTNSDTDLVNSVFEISTPGWYMIDVRGAASSTDAVTGLKIQITAGGDAIDGASQTINVAANGRTVFTIAYPIRVIASPSGIAKIAVTLSAAATVDAICDIHKVI